MQSSVTLLRAELVSGTTTIIGHTTVVTPDRAFVRTDELIDLGTSVDLTLSFPGAVPALRLRGNVTEHRHPSGPGLGSGLWFAIEAPTGDDLARLESLAELRTSSGSLRVLMVEDSRLTCDVFRHIAGSSTRVTIDTVSDSATAWSQLSTGNYHVLVVDHFLPSSTGADLIAQVRANPALSALPIIGISVGGKVARDAMLTAGVDLFLEKPVDVRHLMATLDRLGSSGEEATA
jgi:CheY-like chemotaxis protein